MSDRDDESGGEVLRSLPSRRPQRRSARRDGASAKPAAAKPAAARPKAAAANGAKAGARAARSGRVAGSARTKPKPKGVRPLEATSAASSKPGDPPAHPPEGVELVGTAIQAAGELAQLGLTLGTKALRGAVKRLPRP